MAIDGTRKRVKQISEMDKSILLKALESAKKTRTKVRENIKKGTVPEVPKDIDSALKEVETV
jgi:hypothetical protein